MRAEVIIYKHLFLSMVRPTIEKIIKKEYTEFRAVIGQLTHMTLPQGAFQM